MNVVTSPSGSLRIGHDERLLVLRWSGKPTKETLAFAIDRMRSQSSTYGELVTLSIHHASDPKPGPSTVTRLVSTASEVGRYCELQVVVLVGSSWGASIAHAIFGRVMLESRHSSVRVERELERGVNLVGAALERDPIEVLAALEAHRLLPIPE